MSKVKTVVDSKRGCGWRKEGGFYLRCDGIGSPCGKLPIPLTVCPCCHAGIKPARGWTWIDPRPIVGPVHCGLEHERPCGSCVLANPPEKVGLLWIGERFYPGPEDWIDEGRKLGFSRRISAVPHGFKIGETWVFAAHRLAISEACPHCPDSQRSELENICATCKGTGRIHTPAIFHAFKPSRIEYVTKGTETDAELDDLIKRGIEPVKVVRDIDQPEFVNA